MRVQCKSKEYRDNILGFARKLRNSKDYKNVYINPDLTKMQREQSRKIRDELKSRRDKGESVIIRKGQIVPFDISTNGTLKRPNFQ